MDRISFRKLTEDDIDVLLKWRNYPHVAKWWDGETTREKLKVKMIPRIRGKKPVTPYIIQYDGIDIGYIQTYMLCDYSDYEELVAAGEGAAGIDLYIGEPEYIKRGIGPEAIRKFLREIVFASDETTCCVVGPEPLNVSAIKAYRKAGFEYFRTIKVPEEASPEVIHIIYPDSL